MNREQALNYLRSSGMSEEQVTTIVEALTERPIGHWTRQGMGSTRLVCSECKRFNFSKYKNYCPNCGAKMDSGKGKE